MESHPIVVMQHPLATKSEVEVKAIAGELIEAIVRGLTSST